MGIADMYYITKMCNVTVTITIIILLHSIMYKRLFVEIIKTTLCIVCCYIVHIYLLFDIVHYISASAIPRI